MAAEKLSSELHEKLIRTDEQLSLYKRLYEETNSERKELSTRIQEFTGFIRKEEKLESSGESKEFKPIRDKYVPWKKTQSFLESKATQDYWNKKNAEVIKESVTSITNG